MNLTAPIIKRLLKRKIATLLLVSASVASFATLGDGGKKDTRTDFKVHSKVISLRSTYNFRGDNLLAQPKQGKFILLNTVVTYQKGNATYVLPLKKKVLIDKIKFGPVR